MCMNNTFVDKQKKNKVIVAYKVMSVSKAKGGVITPCRNCLPTDNRLVADGKTQRSRYSLEIGRAHV